jgi:mRNA-degrading endonuclease RelE of RelBE toxin-antitoxin system
MSEFIPPPGRVEAHRGQFTQFVYLYQSRSALQVLWAKEAPPPSPEEIEDRRRAVTHDSDIRLSRRPPEPTEWSIAFTPSFLKSIYGVDKKMQGRILTAIAQLSEEPIALQGDTIKPLDGNLKGLWRFRIGDYRLLYEPRENPKRVVLVDFAARGGVYE